MYTSRLATKMTQDASLKECTSFVMHRSLHAMNAANVIDYSEQRLLRLAKSARDEQQRLVVMTLLHDYKNGDIAIGWRAGNPVFIRVLHEKS
jgi:hypothetical protein